MKLILTGATGFLGTAILEEITTFDVSVIGRSKPESLQTSTFFQANIDANSDYSSALVDGDVVIHSAARVHVMDDKAADSLTAFREVNTRGTINLAKQAAQAGVKRFIFISSIKVNGETTQQSFPFKSDDTFVPNDPYGLSKYEAEIGLREIARKTGMEVVIIRPPLIYGPGVKANFEALMRLVSKPLPLPFGLIKNNKRSMVYISNLVDLIVNCIINPSAANQTFLVSDDYDLSTYELVTYMYQGLGKNTFQLPVPVWFYRLVGKITGKLDVIERLVGSLQVDITHTKNTLNWAPPYTVEQGLADTTKAFLEAENK